jgi:O-antigen/teichoic acid export membrane protein
VLPFSFQVQVVMAKDRMNRQIWASVISVVFKLVCLTIAAHWGVIGVAIGLLITQIVSILVSAQMVWPVIGVRWSDYWQAMRPNFLPLAVAVLSSTLALQVAEHYALSRAQLMVGFGPLAALAVIASYFIARHPIAEETRRIIAQIRSKTP